MSLWLKVVIGLGIIILSMVLFRVLPIVYDIVSTASITLKNSKELILPRLLLESELTEFQKRLPSKPLLNTGLSVVYVIDRSHSVKYITSSDLQKLEISKDELHNIAILNLKKRFSKEVVEKCIADNSVTVLKTMDSYDASRVLLLPEYLPEGVKIVAYIPDKDTLAILPSYDNESIKKLRDVPASGRPLLKNPLLISNQGYELLADNF